MARVQVVLGAVLLLLVLAQLGLLLHAWQRGDGSGDPVRWVVTIVLGLSALYSTYGGVAQYRSEVRFRRVARRSVEAGRGESADG